MRRYDQLRSLGVNVLAAEYPGFGDVGGTRQRGRHAGGRTGRASSTCGAWWAPIPRHIAIYGWSLGTGAAVPLARDVDEAALIVEGALQRRCCARARQPIRIMPIRLMTLLARSCPSDAMPGTGSATLSLHSPDDIDHPGRRRPALFAAAPAPKAWSG